MVFVLTMASSLRSVLRSNTYAGKSDLHAKLGQLSERLGSVLEERSAVSSQLRAVKSENSKLRNQLTSVSKKYDKLEGKLGSLQSLE